MALNTYGGVTLSELGLAYSIPVFYSTNVWVKFFRAERYRRRHYVWCSEGFDTSRQRIQGMPKPPRTSPPCDIYRELLGDVTTWDSHSAKITQQKHSLNSLAESWLTEGGISRAEYEEIVSLVNSGDFHLFGDHSSMSYLNTRLRLQASKS